MLISFRRNFVFVANLKSASTAIETSLRAEADIALCEARFGKHLGLADILARFHWVFDVQPIDMFFVFGVMRQPVDYVLSIFNSHSDPKFADDPRLFTGNLDFDEFIREWVPNNEDQLRPQHTRFVREDGSFGLSCLIPYETLGKYQLFLTSVLSLPEPIRLPRENISPRRLHRSDLTPRQAAWITDRFAADAAFIEEHRAKRALFD